MISGRAGGRYHELQPCASIPESCSAPGLPLSPEEAQKQADEAEPVPGVAWIEDGLP